MLEVPFLRNSFMTRSWKNSRLLANNEYNIFRFFSSIGLAFFLLLGDIEVRFILDQRLEAQSGSILRSMRYPQEATSRRVSSKTRRAKLTFYLFESNDVCCRCCFHSHCSLLLFRVVLFDHVAQFCPSLRHHVVDNVPEIGNPFHDGLVFRISIVNNHKR